MRIHYCTECETLGGLAIVRGMYGSPQSVSNAVSLRLKHREQKHGHSSAQCLEGEQLREPYRVRLEIFALSTGHRTNSGSLPTQLGELRQALHDHHEKCRCPESQL
jgi:hypothetical protein